jgi:serine/threonine-protein kinase
MSSQALADGSIFANRYRIVRCLARGGMGAVYEVVHLDTNRRRALKAMHPHILHSADLRQRFHREARVAAQVESEFIVDVFDTGVDDATGMPYLCMELLRGEELSRRIKRLGRIPPEEAVRYLHQTALALDRTHLAGIVHRDLKPENLFITEREDGAPRIKVLDFGIAKVVVDGASSGPATQSIGTPLYMSPEQFHPNAWLTGASDVFALGMIAYTCLVGVSYWEEEARVGNVFALGAIAIHGPREAASAHAAKRRVALPPGFDEWFAAMTHVDPQQRFSPATAGTRALGDLLGFPVGGPRPGSLVAIPATPPPMPQLYEDQDDRTLIRVDTPSDGSRHASQPDVNVGLAMPAMPAMPVAAPASAPVRTGPPPLPGAAASQPLSGSQPGGHSQPLPSSPALASSQPFGVLTPLGAVVPSPSAAPMPMPPAGARGEELPPFRRGGVGKGKIAVAAGAIAFLGVCAFVILGRGSGGGDSPAPAASAASSAPTSQLDTPPATAAAAPSSSDVAPAATTAPSAAPQAPSAAATEAPSAAATTAPSAAPQAPSSSPTAAHAAPANASSTSPAAKPTGSSSAKPPGGKNPIRSKYTQD